MTCKCRKWEVVGAINGMCVYVKQDLTAEEADAFLDTAALGQDRFKYRWPDGDRIVANLATSAFWSRLMHKYRD